MKAIRNIKELSDILSTESSKWQETVFNQTGVLVLLNQDEGILFSKCGYIELDYDAEYCSKNGVDCTQYCDINNIQELIDYIKAMDGYYSFLLDVSYGKFTKSELFWGIYARIICPMENQKREDGTAYQDWGLYKIGKYKEHVSLYMALVDYDSGEYWIDINEGTNLNEALKMLSNQMCEVISISHLDDIPQYLVRESYSVNVPNDFSEILAQVTGDGLFAWLS